MLPLARAPGTAAAVCSAGPALSPGDALCSSQSLASAAPARQFARAGHCPTMHPDRAPLLPVCQRCLLVSAGAAQRQGPHRAVPARQECGPHARWRRPHADARAARRAVHACCAGGGGRQPGAGLFRIQKFRCETDAGAVHPRRACGGGRQPGEGWPGVRTPSLKSVSPSPTGTGAAAWAGRSVHPPLAVGQMLI